METYKVKEVTNKLHWEKFVLAQDPKSFLQSWNWGETNKLVGEKIFRLGFLKKNKLVGVCLMIKQTAKRGPYLLIPGGPLIDWRKRKLVNFVITEIKKIARRERVWFVRVRPELLESKSNQEMFTSLGFIKSPMHLHAENTWVLDIKKEENFLLSHMRKSARYEIKKSLKSGFDLEITTKLDRTRVLKNLQDITVKRHKFVGFSEKIFKAQLSSFGKDDQAKLFICSKDGNPQAAAIILFYGDTAYYHHSASSLEHKKLFPSRYLQWQIIKHSKSRGLNYYNFWGISKSDNPKHRFYGVTVFKKSFGGSQTDWMHAQDLIFSPKYYATYLFEFLRKISRRL